MFSPLMLQSFSVVGLLLLLGAGAFFGFYYVRQSVNTQVVHELLDDDNSKPLLEALEVGSRPRDRIVRRQKWRHVIWWLVGSACFLIVRTAASKVGVPEQITFFGLGGLAGEMFRRRNITLHARREIRRMEFFLPMAMERIVMAVGSGMDVLPALAEIGKSGEDSISKMLGRVVQLAEKGITVDEALRSIGTRSGCPSVKHAFVHIGLAYKDGGELVRPLRELSDATQSFYQESVEEEIARLPVKAVLPLVVTFTGLIICFLTVPLIQVSTLTAKVAEATKE